MPNLHPNAAVAPYLHAALSVLQTLEREVRSAAVPSSREEAIGNFTVQGPPIDAEVVREIVAVSWDPEGQLPPVLSVSGRPSGLVEGGTTLELVNVWLRRAGDRLGR